MFAIGQRWISDTESTLGLGIIQNIIGRQVEIFFPAADELRYYARDNAPLSRIRFNIGDLIELEDGEMCVTEIEEQNNILFYGDGTNWHPETRLSASIRLNKAVDRFFAGHLDSNKAFELRLEALHQQARLKSSPHNGLLGPRISLLPHQLYIAKEISDREYPRALLADEVGLGKTIEAGLILHRLLLGERIQRVLILTPENLLHQWLIEMLRRFNLTFALLDEERCIGLETQQNGDNPYLHQQLVLSSLSDIQGRPERAEQMVEAGWDLVVVDEAHHLHWRDNAEAEQDPAYALVERLAKTSPGLLLLTATPEQMGVEGHFARLRLLDPDRFHDLHSFLKEEEHYQPVAAAARSLLEDKALTPDQLTNLQQWLDDEVTGQPSPQQRQTWLKQLVDRHGTGRVLFRNTRAVIKGFPERQLREHKLDLPAQYQSSTFDSEIGKTPNALLEHRLYPERHQKNWTTIDPRIDWLKKLLQEHPGEKVLLICHLAETALDLYAALRVRYGLHCAVFHQGMSIIERDRAGAYFADPDEGSQMLLCSEIGSEGRNFQFAHHLVLFDLPLNCDLLEQRIGRLDRIGQLADIQIHVPYFGGHLTQELLGIYHRAFDLFTSISPGAQTLMDAHQEEITAALLSSSECPAESRKKPIEDLISMLLPQRRLIEKAMEQGRDVLLELHSCDQEASANLVKTIEQEDQLGASGLQPFLDRVCDVYGIEQDEDSLNCHILRPGDHMRISAFPYLPEDGLTYTSSRQIAVSRDEITFFTWEHPLVTSALDLILNEELGNSCLAYLPKHEHKTGDFYLQMQFALSCQAPANLQLQRYLPAAALHITRMPTGKLRKGQVTLPCAPHEVHRTDAALLVRTRLQPLQSAVKQIENAAQGLVPEILDKATLEMHTELNGEIDRLVALKKHNPNVREDEINALISKKQALGRYIGEAQLHTDCIRVVFCG